MQIFQKDDSLINEGNSRPVFGAWPTAPTRPPGGLLPLHPGAGRIARGLGEGQRLQSTCLVTKAPPLSSAALSSTCWEAREAGPPVECRWAFTHTLLHQSPSWVSVGSSLFPSPRSWDPKAGHRGADLSCSAFPSANSWGSSSQSLAL